MNRKFSGRWVRRIMMFGAHKTKSIEGERVLVLVDGGKEAAEALCALGETRCQTSARYPGIEAQDCDGDND